MNLFFAIFFFYHFFRSCVHFAFILSRFFFFFFSISFKRSQLERSFRFYFVTIFFFSLRCDHFIFILSWFFFRFFFFFQFRADDHNSNDHFIFIQSWFFFFSFFTILSHRFYSVMIFFFFCHFQSLFHRVHHFSIKSIDNFSFSFVFCAKYSRVFNIVITTTKKWCLLSVIFHILTLISN